MPSSPSSAPVVTAFVCAAALGTAAWAGGRAMASKKSSSTNENSAAKFDVLPPGAFDVAVIGAGPAGSTAAYYLAKGGARVALLEKEKFPRDKPCHGGLSASACAILKDMGVLADLHGTVLAVAVSETAPARGLHVERSVLDSKLASAARAAGADLRLGFEVSGMASSFDSASGMWTVRSTRSSLAGGGRSSGSSSGGSGESGEVAATGNEGGSIAARLLILADGASSNVGLELGFVVAAASDGQRKSLNGGEREAAVVAVPSPGDDDAAAAPSAAPRQRVASRGVPSSHGHHWLIVGEAAGHAEALPAEGEGSVEVFQGIHTAMRGGELAAAAALEMRARGDFSASATRAYERSWRREFGSSIVDAWPRAVRRAVESRSDLLESLSGELRQLRDFVSSKVSTMSAPPLLSSTAEVAKTALASAAASAVAAAKLGASMRMSLSGDGGSKSKSSSSQEKEPKEESTAESATASVEVSISPSGKGGGNLAAALAAAEGEFAAA